MSDFALSPDELAAICRRMTAANDDISTRVDRIRGSEVGSGDFGGSRHATVARQYLHLVNEVMPALFGGYAAASESMADRLADVLSAYHTADSESVPAIRSIAAGSPGDR